MKKPEIAKELARQSGVSRAEAADGLDRLVRHIVSNLRHGKGAALPGFGKFSVDPKGKVRFEPAGGKRG